MENVALGGFDHSKPNENICELNVRLVDCGSITEVTSLTYRSLEVHFGKSWTRSTDVWPWGIILAQLLQAKVDPKSPGMYDSISTATLEDKTRVACDKLAIDFDPVSIQLYAEDKECVKMLLSPRPEQAYMWANEMVEKGVSGEDVQFLVGILTSDPNAHLAVPEILERAYLER
ncbi:hypothetical protein AJ78_05087 [Emergomyces pasteurianus Ep9510]|uniref:Protein kinase domain-containing protein n=1 Tax=Emergomyces pasteurianus Ep9510 TaxID=1447872 RepID=A0A1J9PDH1_9EURO|nr:hypothetical protein AJ78_05087 [Emergomyces pasteurianus Ep9510]